MSDTRDKGDQPVGELIEAGSLGNHDLVDASPEQLTHKQVQRERSISRTPDRKCLGVSPSGHPGSHSAPPANYAFTP